MSNTVLVPPGVARPPSRSAARAGALLTILLMLFGGLFFGPTPAQAATLGIGYGNEDLWLGSFSAHGRQAYCMDLDAVPPWGNTQHPELKTTLDSLTSTELARLNYVMGRWGESQDPNVTAAVQMYVWDVADHGNYAGRGGDAHFITRVPAAAQGTVLANLNGMRDAAAANAVENPSVSLSISMSDQYQGQVTVSTNPASATGTVTLTNATFANGSATATLGAGTHQIVGTPPVSAPDYQITAAMQAPAIGYGAGVDLFYTPGEQRILAAASFEPLSATAKSPVIPLDFQPVIETVVSAKFVQAGDVFTDKLAVSVTKHSWIKVNGNPVPVLAEGTLYGPFDAQPAEANAPPQGAPVLGTETLTLTHPGSYVSPGTLTAPESGFYTWVWKIDKQQQGGNAKYLTDSFTDRFGRVAETSITPFQPEAVSKANGRLVKPGDAVTDTITVESSNGRWLQHNGDLIPVVFEGTAYQVPGTLPPAQGAQIPAGAAPIGTVQVTATGPGTYESPEVILPDAGFVTWVWQVKKASQPEWVRPYIASDWQDDYGINIESHSVRWPLTITSEVREYNVHAGGRAFDRITVSGFPDNHPDFEGDGYWGPDEKELTHTVYGPFKTDAELTDDLDLETAPVLTTISTPAKNGVYDIGYTDDDRIQPENPGYYVVVTTFAGDDRVQPFQSSPADIWERFYVPDDQQPLSVITQATPVAGVGEEFDDAALVQGSKIPDDSYLVFRAYGPHDPDAEPVCDVPFFTSEKIPVTQAGIYRSGKTSVDRAGHVYWVETLYGKDGKVLAEGRCGAPGETTVVTDTPPKAPPTPETPELPKLPPELPVTGGSGFPWLIAAGGAVALLAAGFTLWFGRRLALSREQGGYVREEDEGIEELMNN
ncbi:LPXTG cell wall anchor domain-containing protein [Leucobacter celer]|uniref:LPXTG cell wall anchor domain-containing protein n=1 Tax=Leucobacter celer TaxID=668625 RepID=UPI0006A7BB77|nr:LPXTG cell wall anchor domain-containing protein [Leucobacter celer]